MKGETIRQKIRLTGRRFTEIAEIMGITPQALNNILNADGCKNYRSFAQRLNNNLHTLKPGLTSYWARHSWATIAADLDISEDTIALALGHSSAHTTTAIYIQRDMKKVDAANRKVIDWVLYGKK